MDTMGMSRMTTVSAQIGMPRMAEASRMAQSTRFSPKSAKRPHRKLKLIFQSCKASAILPILPVIS